MIIKTILTILTVLVFVGCSTQPTFKTIDSCVIDDELSPSWACGIQPKELNNMFTASSSESLEGTNETYARKIATAKARGALAQLLETNVEDKVSLEEDLLNNHNKTSTKTISQKVLVESKVVAYWKHPSNNRIYILVGVER